MTCAHVRGLMDAGPLADYPRSHLEKAWQHARQCAACGPAMHAAAALTADLAALPQAAPPDLAREVMARIERIEEARAVLVDAEATASSRRDEWTAWAIVPGVLAAALVTGDIPLPTESGTIALATGLLLYLATLFMPIEVRPTERSGH